MKNSWRLIVVLVLILPMLLSGGKDVSAAAIRVPSPQTDEVNPNAPDCFAIDIVFLIDQSGSMSRQGNPNDPLGQRFNAPKYALDWLANNRLARLAQCPDVIHRVGMVSFGTDVEVDLPLTPINPANDVEWNDTRPNLDAAIKERNLAATDPAKSLDVVKRLWDQAGPPPNDLPRKRAIVLLTDGQPCVPGLGCGSEGAVAGNAPWFEAYMKSFVDDANSLFPFQDSVRRRDEAIRQAEIIYGGASEIPDEEKDRILIDYPITNEEYASSTYFWIIAMNAASPYLDKVGNYFKTIASNHNGDLIDLQQNLTEIPKVFNIILSRLAGITPTYEHCGKLAVNPYLSSAVLDIYKAANGLEVEIDYRGKVLKNGEGDKELFGLEQYSSYGAVEHYRFRQPPAGLWELVCSDPTGAEAAYIAFKPQVQMTAPDNKLPQYDVDGKVSDPNFPYYLRYVISDQTSNFPLNEDPNYKLDLKAIITGPDGSQYAPLEMGFVQDGTWESKDPIPVNQLLLYKVDILGLADCVVNPAIPDSCPSPTFEVVRDSTGTYEVGSIIPFRLVITKPTEGEILALHSPPTGFKLVELPVQVELQLLGEDNNALSPSEALESDPGQSFKAVLEAGGESQEITLTVAEDPTKLVGIFEKPFAGGENTLTVSLVGSYRHETHRPYEKSVAVKFTRQDTIWTNPAFYKGMSAIVGLILGIIALLIILCKVHQLRGELRFTKDGRIPVTIGIAKGWCRTTIKRIDSNLLGDEDFRLKKIVLVRRGPKNTQRVIGVKFYCKEGVKTKEMSDSENGQGTVVSLGGWRIVYACGLPEGKKKNGKINDGGGGLPSRPTRKSVF